MSTPKIKYQNRLPHIAPMGACFFVTFRLGDSLPQNVLDQLRAERDASLEEIKETMPDNWEEHLPEIKQQDFLRYEYQLDHMQYGHCYLRREEIADVVIQQLLRYDGVWYDLHAYCIMPNHAHILIDTSIQIDHMHDAEPDDEIEYVQLFRIMKHIKGSSGFYANQIIGRRGTFWQKDSYDHYIRSTEEWNRTVAYILNNPVEAGLVADWRDWAKSYFKFA